MVIGQLSANANAPPSTISEKALDVIRTAADAEAKAMAETVATTVHKSGNAVAGLPDTLTAVQDGRAKHVVVLSGFVQPAYRFVDSGYIVLELSDEVELGSGRAGTARRRGERAAPGDGPRHRRHHPRRRQGVGEARQDRSADPLLDNSRSPAVSLAHCTRLPGSRGFLEGLTRYDKPCAAPLCLCCIRAGIFRNLCYALARLISVSWLKKIRSLHHTPALRISITRSHCEIATQRRTRRSTPSQTPASDAARPM